MTLSSSDIREKTFAKQLWGGYRPAEVQSFLQQASEALLLAHARERELAARLEAVSADLDRVRQIEGALLHALGQAEQQQRQILDQAQQAADLRVREGEVAGEALVNAAKVRAEALLRQAQEAYEAKLAQMQADFGWLEDTYRETEAQAARLVAQMRGWVGETNAQLAQLESLKGERLLGQRLATAKDLLRSHAEAVGRQAQEEAAQALSDELAASDAAASGAAQPDDGIPLTLHQRLARKHHPTEDLQHLLRRLADEE
jgi:cell division initiation protein